MSDLEVRIGDDVVVPGQSWALVWEDREHGLARLVSGERAIPVVVEGEGADWVVTLHGRRVPVTVRTWRERLMAEAATAEPADAGPVTVKATLPGLVVAVAVEPGAEVAEGDPLLTIEAMKMQNEVRAPRAGQVLEVSVAAGQAVATGAPLLRLA